MKNKTKLILSIACIVIIIAIIIIIAMFAENGIISEKVSEALALLSMIPLFFACLYAGKIDYETSLFECRNCNHIFKPTKSEYIWGSHSMTTRYLKCPECGKKTWCKRIPDTNA